VARWCKRGVGIELLGASWVAWVAVQAVVEREVELAGLAGSGVGEGEGHESGYVRLAAVFEDLAGGHVIGDGAGRDGILGQRVGVDEGVCRYGGGVRQDGGEGGEGELHVDCLERILEETRI